MLSLTKYHEKVWARYFTGIANSSTISSNTFRHPIASHEKYIFAHDKTGLYRACCMYCVISRGPHINRNISINIYIYMHVGNTIYYRGCKERCPLWPWRGVASLSIALVPITWLLYPRLQEDYNIEYQYEHANKIELPPLKKRGDALGTISTSRTSMSLLPRVARVFYCYRLSKETLLR